MACRTRQSWEEPSVSRGRRQRCGRTYMHWASVSGLARRHALSVPFGRCECMPSTLVLGDLCPATCGMHEGLRRRWRGVGILSVYSGGCCAGRWLSGHRCVWREGTSVSGRREGGAKPVAIVEIADFSGVEVHCMAGFYPLLKSGFTKPGLL
ncbi:hypothetical protein DFH06DRAFT_483524 [Mycena polygramma]|nr:hypothetical protein DFH06DRAFT_483524 [Mycena polygramma]